MTSPGAEGQVFRIRDESVSWRDVDGEIVALDVESGDYFTLNGSGRLLWLALLEPVTTDALAQVLCESFEIPQDVACSDATAFLEDLIGRRVVGAVA